MRLSRIAVGGGRCGSPPPGRKHERARGGPLGSRPSDGGGYLLANFGGTGLSSTRKVWQLSQSCGIVCFPSAVARLSSWQRQQPLKPSSVLGSGCPMWLGCVSQFVFISGNEIFPKTSAAESAPFVTR